MKIQIAANRAPVYATSGSAAFDLHADIPEELHVLPGRVALIPTGLRLAIPDGYVGLVCPRSGLALKHGITVLNAPGVIDSDYRDVVGVILINLGAGSFTIQRGDRIAQLMIAPVVRAEFDLVPQLDETVRGTGGFGSTGV
jgi:dUTP pyrophosphatase